MKTKIQKKYNELMGLIETVPKIKARISALTLELSNEIPDKGEESGVSRNDKQWTAVDYKKAYYMALNMMANKAILNHCLDYATITKTKPMFYEKGGLTNE